MSNNDKVNHPDHYNAGNIEVIDAIEDWCLGFHLGNTVKYIARAMHKGNPVEDLEKALWYLKRYIKLADRLDDVAPAETKITPAQAADDWRLGPDMAAVVEACATRVKLKAAAVILDENISLLKECP